MAEPQLEELAGAEPLGLRVATGSGEVQAAARARAKAALDPKASKAKQRSYQAERSRETQRRGLELLPADEESPARARLLAQREGRNIVRMRKHAMWYMTGLPGAAAARGKINACVGVDDFDAVFDELLEIAGSHA